MNIIDYSRALSSQQFDYPYYFYDDIGVNCELPNIKIIKVWDQFNLNIRRHVYLQITSFKGFTETAMHYYCTFIIDGIILMSNNNILRTNNPLEQRQYKLRLYHPLSNDDMAEKDYKGNYRYNSLWYKEGDYVESFKTLSSLFNMVIDVINNRFKGNWEFILYGLSNDRFAHMENNKLTIDYKL